MKRILLLLLLLQMSVIAGFADEYKDPATNVIYTYEPGQSTASVKAGHEESDGSMSIDFCPGSPDAAGDVVILDKFSIGTNEYVVTSISECAFWANNNIKSVIIPETVTDIGVAAFECCDGLTAVQLPEGLTRISRDLFRECGQLGSVAIPSSVRAIDEQAFAYCRSLASLTLPAGLKYIGRYAFQNTPWYSAQYNEAPDGLFYIGPLLVGYKGNVPTGDLVIKEGTTCIGYEAFNYCTGLTSVTIPESLTHVDVRAFYNCAGLTAVHITDLAAWCKIEFQWDYATSSSNPLCNAHHLYLNGEEVTDLVIPDGVTSIGRYAFDNCTGLTSVTIPDGVTRIRPEAFRNCSNLTSITIPPSMKTIDSSPFVWCRNLNAVHISDIAAWCGISFQAASDVFCYGAHLYLNGEEVKDLVIPDGVASIGGWSFLNCSQLTSVTIPESVTVIGDEAFEKCTNLTDVYCYAENVPNMRYGVFFYTPIASATLHVPAGSIDKYKTTSPWSDFANIVALPQQYFPEGTKWTEIRLDTLKYNSWYSKVGDDWVPNFETIEYYVQGVHTDKHYVLKKVYTNGPEWTDSLTLLLYDGYDDCFNKDGSGVLVTVPNIFDESYTMWPGVAYQFDWSVGKGLYYRDIMESNSTGEYPYYFFFGVIKEIKEGDFGGVRPLKYVDLDGKAPDNTYEYWDWGYTDTRGGRIIQGIGITEWNDGECLFGPPDPYYAGYGWRGDYKSRHYRSMLVHFERDGEVLYDV
ncbi:MAG: leucine-rich repeat domain-containing protein, partial [Bacteroidaceae bacterium]|nr:leucine-rich repeat domain-containing protein [Bacteroidaceae bacterium]